MRRAALMVLASVVAASCAAAGVAVLDVRVAQSGWRLAVVLGATLSAALVAAALTLLGRRSPRLAAEAGVVLGAALLAGLSMAALDGTRWGWYGLFADSAFRTQMATRYAEGVALVDYGYRGLPAYYPPAVGWIQGRVADLTGMPGWAAVRPVQIAVGAAVPVLAYGLWLRVVGAPRAAAVAVLTALWCAHPQKPDEWVVLTCLVPWWLLAVRDVRTPGSPRPRAWALGIVLGLLVLVHTYYFLPLGIATLLALGSDVLARRRGRSPRLPLPRALGIGAVALLVSSPYWAGAVLARLRLPSDSLQLRYAKPGGNEPVVVPDPWEPVGLAVLCGLAWLAWAAWRRWRGGRDDLLAGGLALALAGALATLGVGALLERADVGVLAFKTNDLLEMLLVTCGVLGGAHLLGHLLGRVRPGVPRRLASAAAAVAAAVATGTATHHVAVDWATGSPALVANTTRYPDGLRPAGAGDLEQQVPVLFVRADDPPAADVLAGWDRLRPALPRSRTVLVTSRVDLLATTPVHGFLAFKSIYSHPNGRFEDRVELLREVAACPNPACAAGLLRDNPYDRVDGLVLERAGDQLTLRFMVDDFPDRTRREQVVFPADLFAAPWFERADVGRWTVLAVR
ncbi:arabinofuranosyltransferase [Nocardioides sp. SYSU D00065]|uniref:arabinofuranosyltransferase n=1 Tax=Nocardioides sp. SYSU D00065 TaxID=2817378 RepID=UPI001B33E105|nr:arabinofuranosyltransferase [Nocardioides sp. SYSU D00065]